MGSLGVTLRLNPTRGDCTLLGCTKLKQGPPREPGHNVQGTGREEEKQEKKIKRTIWIS